MTKKRIALFFVPFSLKNSEKGGNTNEKTKRAWACRYLVKEIRLYDDKIEMQFNSPILKSPDESQGFLLYTKIARMPYVTLRDPNPDLDVMKIEIYIW